MRGTKGAHVPVWSPEVIAEIPHDSGAFTQGLVFDEARLYESTGQLGRSQLRELESDGVVQRKVKATVPPQVTYSLTKAGDELIPTMSDLCHWATKYLGIPPMLPMVRRARSGMR